MSACLNKVIPYSFIDGPGSRMVLFLQGCNLRCLYCHNPETQNRCNHCGKCLAVCPSGALSRQGDRLAYDAAICRNCDRCLAECPHCASPKCREVTPQEILRQIDAARDFLDGVTVSGGEATLQADFVFELFAMIQKANASATAGALSTFLDTNGWGPREVFERMSRVTDGFMVDLKAYDSGKHFDLTGADNAPVLENIKWLGATGLLYEIRTVIVPGYTDDESEIRNIATLVQNLNATTRLKLIAFRPLGVKTFLRDAPSLDKGQFQKLLERAQQILGDRATGIS